MAASLRGLAAAARRPVSRSCTAAPAARHQAQYPFTRGGSPEKPSAGTSAPYPFTNRPAGQQQKDTPTTVAEPTGAVQRPGPPITVEQPAVEAADVHNQPDYGAAADYRTSAPARHGRQRGARRRARRRAVGRAHGAAGAHRAHLPAGQDGHAVGRLARAPLADGLGRAGQGPPVGESGKTRTGPMLTQLMGWQSSGDMMQATKVNFKSKADAIRFAEKQGYEYYVQEPNHRRFTAKAYATQFEHSAGRLKQVRTK